MLSLPPCSRQSRPRSCIQVRGLPLIFDGGGRSLSEEILLVARDAGGREGYLSVFVPCTVNSTYPLGLQRPSPPKELRLQRCGHYKNYKISSLSDLPPPYELPDLYVRPWSRPTRTLRCTCVSVRSARILFSGLLSVSKTADRP
ncbi:PREDICTED: uncharacterized protein LOC105566761 [Vollenhovia emeryi]|uniref:uncharacterized protein LOC105566761 n=1 Tax=Vollenhovia emeryi TaxID=411798 RepID=UPI0005F521D4|nr:PREDICTED: uncharacterized protein LOC105566761 [Vollenhovia emeryi]